MQCREFEQRMQLLLDQRCAVEQDPALRNHASQCPRCRAELDTLAQLFDGLDLLEVPELPTDFAHRVVRAVVTDRPCPASKSTPSAWRILTPALVAAALLLALLPVAWHLVLAPDRVARQSSPAARDNETAVVAETVAPSSDATRTPDDSWLVSTAILELYPEETRERHRDTVSQLADDLRPIAVPFNAALTAIRRSIPGAKQEPKGKPSASLSHPLPSRQTPV